MTDFSHCVCYYLLQQIKIQEKHSALVPIPKLDLGITGRSTITNVDEVNTPFWIPRHVWHGFRGSRVALEVWDMLCGLCLGGWRCHTVSSQEITLDASMLFHLTTFCEDTFSPWWYIYLAILWLWGIHKEKIKISGVRPTEPRWEIKATTFKRLPRLPEVCFPFRCL